MNLQVFEWFEKRISNISVFNKNFRKQLFATLIVNTITFSHGLVMGWTAPTLKIITSEQTPLSFSVSLQEASWIGSLPGLGALTASLILSNLVNTIGRKYSLYILALPHICCWVLIYFAKNVETLYVARFLSGLTGGASLAVIPLFLSEISDKNLRGTLLTSNIVALSSGFLSGYIICSLLDFYLVPCIAIWLPIVYMYLISHVPETPQFLLKNEMHEEAWKSFKFYKNFSIESNEIEFKNLKTTIERHNYKEGLSFKDFVNKQALKSYPTGIVIVLLNAFSGLYAFTSYMSEIFRVAGSPMDPNTCTIIIGTVQLIGNCIANFLVDSYGRRKLLIHSMIGLIFGLTAFGCCTFYRNSIDSKIYNWIPLIIMSFIIVVGNIGIGTIFSTLLVEIFPVKIRLYALSSCLSVMCLLFFVLSKFFLIIMHEVGISITMWSLAGICCILFIYIIIFLSETKGTSLDKI